MTNPDLDAIKKLRRHVIDMVFQGREGHIPSAFSILEILYVVYRSGLRYDARNPDWEGRDRFVLSKGHAGSGLYAVLAHFGFFSPDILNTYCQAGSILGGHPDRTKVPGVEVSTGSLGHGIAVAVGMALALRLKGSAAKVVCLVGDGEMDEGSFWESITLARNTGLANLVVIADCNGSQKYSSPYSFKNILSAFGWNATEVDGHDLAALSDVLVPAIHDVQSGPLFIAAQTTKGYGVKRFEGEHAWHRRMPTASEYAEIMAELA